MPISLNSETATESAPVRAPRNAAVVPTRRRPPGPRTSVRLFRDECRELRHTDTSMIVSGWEAMNINKRL
ncbi:hypothetical protein GCM10009557_32980 [Virgisporangium ochraceum]|uniref:Uncharacterized protein n=1 Tax=Virgisporangium ochraceum TaxID=65505 RepID=A0A8J4EDF1_9ACTN|nr:hypothetical protein Voc01_063720 [Virgisporangium ochraceum]